MHVLMTKITGDVLQMAPIDTAKPLRVLDIGTGTGVCEFGFILPLGPVVAKLTISQGPLSWLMRTPTSQSVAFQTAGPASP